MKSVNLLLVLAVVLLVTSLGIEGCVLGTSIEQRLQMFEDDLNLVDRSNAYLNFYEGLTDEYDLIKNPDFVFDVAFPNEADDFPYVITIIDDSNSSAVDATISAVGLGGDRAITFEMAADGLNWLIVEIPYMEGWFDGDDNKVVD